MNLNKLGDEYLLLKELGEGGFATVYKVRNLKYGYVRALRVLNAFIRGEDDPKFQSFLRECKIQLNLGAGCPANIVRIDLPVHKDGLAFVEMDLVDGVDLRKLIERHRGMIPVNETIRMAHDIGSALAYCHHDVYKYRFDKEQDNIEDADDGSALITPEKERELIGKYRVLHNDIHTGNIMRRDRDGTYMLLDFGLAVDGINDMMGESRKEHGAIEFKSPSRLDGKQPVPQDDIYSFGCVLYTMLTGKPPFPIKDKWENIIEGKKIEKESESEDSRVIMAHKNNNPSPIERTDVPHWLKEMTMRCLAKNSSDRYADGYELYQEILKHIEKASRSLEPSQTNDAALMEKINVLVAEKNSLSSSLNELQTELDGKTIFCEHLEEMLDEMTSKADGLNIEKEKIKGDYESLKKSNNKFRKKLVSLLVLSVLTGAIALTSVLYFTGFVALPGQAIVKESDLDKIHSDIVSLTVENDSLQNTINAMRKSSNANSDQYASLVQEKNALEKQIESLNGQIKELNATNKKLTAQIRSSQNSKNAANTAKIKELEKQLRASQKTLSTAQSELRSAKKQEEKLLNKISELEKTNSNLRKENRALLNNM